LVYNPSSGFAVQSLPSTLALAILSSLTPRFLETITMTEPEDLEEDLFADL
jgi:hypothetical protein